ncbi:MAG: DUF2156 domain-containing protein [Ruminococcus sp.]|nr:DUF2156 domain-containing protein [Ruminococcus sp.]
MLDFHPIEKSKIPLYESFYDRSSALGLEGNFASAYLWSSEYKIGVALFHDTLIKAYYRGDGTIWGYCMPTGKNVADAVEAVFADAKERGQHAYFGYLSQSERDTLEAMYPERFLFERSTTTQDYIYLASDLAQLSGKKYHAKRNHISKYHRLYGEPDVREITSENTADMLAVARGWCEENELNYREEGEYAVLCEAADNLRDLQLRGILIYIENKPVAFALGKELSAVCFDISFEKALTAYDGSYAVINNEFAKRLTSYTYINREEDMGLEGLRKAKLSYHPVRIYDRYDGVPQW